LTQPLGYTLGSHAGDEIVGAARTERHYEPDRAVGPFGMRGRQADSQGKKKKGSEGGGEEFDTWLHFDVPVLD
jgi:hypothetical protein